MSERVRRWGHGTAAVARHLYDTTRPLTQVELARQAGLSQPAVSKALGLLRRHGATVNANPGWMSDRSALLDAYVEGHASRLIDAETWWYQIDSAREQADRIAAALDDVVLSGDAAADVLNPWRFPTAVIAYTDADPDRIAELGFVTADDRNVASLLLRPVPDQRFVLDAREIDGLRIAHPLHLAADLLTLGTDRAEHARRIIAA